MRRVSRITQVGGLLLGVGFLAAFAWTKLTPSGSASMPPVTKAQILRGRALVINHDCGGCHGGGADPNAAGWLSGVRTPQDEFHIGPCGNDPNAGDPKTQPCFITRPKNLTPDKLTGTGSFTQRQLFNALRYGLRPEDTPDMVITSSNFPKNPKYLAPPMPWMAWRHMSDAELWSITAYLKYGLKPVVNKVQDSEGPPDFWASEMTVAKIGTYPAPAFPGRNEVDGSANVAKR